jgi:peptide/nickel transport system substrate-binding protein
MLLPRGVSEAPQAIDFRFPLRLCASVVLLLILALSGGAQASPAPAEKVLRVAYNEDVATFDPDDVIILFGLDAQRVLYEGLVQYRPGTTEIIGWLAQSWSISPDGRIYTFTLHDGVTFHDGKTLTASDVLAYFRRRQHPSLPLSYFLDDVQDMSAPDPKTFVITLKNPQPAFLDRLASPWAPKVIGPQALVDHEDGDLGVGWLTEHADGTGPFKLIEFTRGQRYVLARNPDYWGPQPYFDKIEILIVPTTNQQMLMLQRGELDIVEHGYPFDQLAKLPQGLKVDAHDALGLEMAYVNQTKALRNPAIRKAVITAINPAGWLTDAFGSFAAPPRSLYPKAMIMGPDPVQFPTDFEAARKAVADAGPVAIEIGYADEEAPAQQRVAEFMVSLLKQIGVTATVRTIPLDQESSLVNDLARAPDIFIAQNYPDAVHPATQTGVFFETGAALNLFGYSNPKVDAMSAEAGQITERSERDRKYLAISKLLFDDGAFIPLADIKDVIVYRAGLVDLNTRPALPWAVDYGTIRRE